MDPSPSSGAVLLWAAKVHGSVSRLWAGSQSRLIPSPRCSCTVHTLPNCKWRPWKDED